MLAQTYAARIIANKMSMLLSTVLDPHCYAQPRVRLNSALACVLKKLSWGRTDYTTAADWTGCPSHICSLPAAMRLATFYRHCVWCACTFVRKYHCAMHQLVAVTLG